MKHKMLHASYWLPHATQKIVDNFHAKNYSVLRILAKAPGVDDPKVDSYGSNVANLEISKENLVGMNTQSDDYNLITSMMYVDGIPVNSDPKGDKILHAPVIDLDVPCELVASTQPGHWHLYINKPMLWDDYCALLKSLVEAGIVEDGYYKASLKRGFSAIRPVSRLKPGLSQKSSTYYVKMNAIYERQNFFLKIKHDNLVDYVESLEKVIQDAGLELPEPPDPKPIPKPEPPIVETKTDLPPKKPMPAYIEMEKTLVAEMQKAIAQSKAANEKLASLGFTTNTTSTQTALPFSVAYNTSATATDIPITTSSLTSAFAAKYILKMDNIKFT
jgi:hypothetical protein